MMNERGEYGAARRVANDRQRMRQCLSTLAAGSKIALEAGRNWRIHGSPRKRTEGWIALPHQTGSA